MRTPKKRPERHSSDGAEVPETSNPPHSFNNRGAFYRNRICKYTLPPTSSCENYPGSYNSRHQRRKPEQSRSLLRLTTGVSNNDNFAIGVNVINGIATFCVMPDSNYLTWALTNSSAQGGIPFSFDNCILNEQTTQTTLSLTPTSQGSWDVVAVNINPQKITVE